MANIPNGGGGVFVDQCALVTAAVDMAEVKSTLDLIRVEAKRGFADACPVGVPERLNCR